MDEIQDPKNIEEKSKLQLEIEELKARLKEKENELNLLTKSQKDHSLSKEEVVRYSRQIILPQVGVKGQEKLKSSSVLIVGCGGLGCPAAQYLAGSGFGRVGLVDYDEVEMSNLHRQLMHDEKNIGVPKVKSLAQALNRLNSNVKVDEHQLALSSDNALELVGGYDMVIDASDNPATRYLVGDACVLSRRPLISASAARLEAHITVCSLMPDSPCYRCLFPKPPPASAVDNCSEVGILPHVVGVMGTLAGMQAVFISLARYEATLHSRLLFLDASDTSFKTLKLVGRRPDCPACGDTPSITSLGPYDHLPSNDKCGKVELLTGEERVHAKELAAALEGGICQVVDVRPSQEFSMWRIAGSINLPMESLDKASTIIQPLLPVYVVCRRGNDSQLAVRRLKELLPTSCHIKDLKGGLHAWAKCVDPSFPIY